MKKLDNFGVELKQGKNLELLRQAQSYFSSKRGKTIVSYKYTTDATKVRVFNSLKSKDLKQCSICDRSLYYFENQNGKPEALKVRQKKKIILLDDCGEEHHCCFKFASCLRRVNFNPEKADYSFQYRIPTFLDFLEIEEEEVESNKEYVEEAEKSYNSLVVPFMQKWIARPINKGCLMEFLDDLSALERHMVYYEDDATKGKVFDKIYKKIGIQV